MRALLTSAVLLPLLAALSVSADASAQVPDCWVRGGNPAERPSPLDSASVQIGDGVAKVCYGAPSARGRTMIGGSQVPYADLWRMGANEATSLHLSFAAEVAGVALEPGSYSVYAIPGEEEWTIYLNSSVERWGIPISDEVQANDVGHGMVASESLEEHVETMTLRFDATGEDTADLVLDWEHTRVRIPVRRTGGPSA